MFRSNWVWVDQELPCSRGPHLVPPVGWPRHCSSASCCCCQVPHGRAVPPVVGKRSFSLSHAPHNALYWEKKAINRKDSDLYSGSFLAVDKGFMAGNHTLQYSLDNGFNENTKKSSKKPLTFYQMLQHCTR